MPNVPARYESQVAPQANRRIIEQPTFAPDTSMGDAAKSVADVGLQIAGRVQKSITARELVTAEREARTRLDKLKFDLEADAETLDAAIPVRWRQESDAILKEVAGKISSSAARDVWSENAKIWQGDGETWSYGLQRKRSVEKVRAGHITAAAELEAQSGDLTISAETYSKNLANEKAAIQGDLERGMLDPEAAARQEAALDLLQTRDIDIRTSANIDALVAQGRIAEADAQFKANYERMSPALRAQIEKGLTESKQDYAVVEKGDEFWAKAKGDIGAYLKLTADVKDAPLRVKLEARGTQLANQAQAAEDARQENLQSVAWKHVEGGGTIASLSPSIRGAIDPARLSSIRAYENARDAENGMDAASKAMWTIASSGWRDELESAAAMPASVFIRDPSTWSDQDRAKFNALTPADKNAIRAKQMDMRDRGGTMDEISKVENQLMDVAKVVADPKWGLRKSYDQQPPNAKKLLGEIRAQARGLAADNAGRPLTREQVERAVAQALVQASKPDDGFPMKKTPSGDLFPDYGNDSFAQWQMFSMRADPEFSMNVADRLDYEKAFADLKAAGDGVDPTFEEVQALLAKRRGGGR